ncbi:hypothetical protein VPH35_092522 [Triticum aestivum]
MSQVTDAYIGAYSFTPPPPPPPRIQFPHSTAAPSRPFPASSHCREETQSRCRPSSSRWTWIAPAATARSRGCSTGSERRASSSSTTSSTMRRTTR